MFFIGDVHGKWEAYFDLLEVFGNRKSIQVGDFGMGFSSETPPKWDMAHRFIRGNHDDPEVCRAHPNYLGDYGVTEDGIFFVGGGYSIDYEWRQLYNHRHPNRQVWWEDEEIAAKEFPLILEQYKAMAPNIVVAHDAPTEVKALIVEGNIVDKRRFINRTSDGLMSEMLKVFKPALWIFGHYHCSSDFEYDGTRFVGLDELEVFEIDHTLDRDELKIVSIKQ